MHKIKFCAPNINLYYILPIPQKSAPFFVAPNISKFLEFNSQNFDNMCESKLGYEIPDKKFYKGSYGSLSEPHIFKVVYGQKFQNSLRTGSIILNLNIKIILKIEKRFYTL